MHEGFVLHEQQRGVDTKDHRHDGQPAGPQSTLMLQGRKTEDK